MTLKILVTDYAWPSLDIERRLFAEVGAELLVAETGEEAELVGLAPRAAGILTNWKRVTPAVLDAAPDCRIVSRYGVGVDNIAVAHATTLGIPVTNVPDYCFEEVSDHAMALLLACARKVVKFANATKAGKWDVKLGRPLPRLREQTLGIVGYGYIGRALAPKAAGFGLRVLVHSPRATPESVAPYEWTNDLERVLRESDYVSLHVPLTEATRGMINATTLRLMKPTAFLINTSRGPVIDEGALAEAVRSGVIAGAALDVLSQEPGNPAHPLFGLENVIITPHAAFYSESAIEELQHKAVGRVVQALRGEQPSNIINPDVVGRENYRLKD
jgi:D-3-phosphoglycerate dehydrogenase